MAINDEIILNTGLTLAMDFGSDWLKPIHERLSARFPTLSHEDLDRYNKVCHEAMDKGHRLIYKKLESVMKENKNISNEELAEHLKNFLAKKYPWINVDNFSKLLSQGIYYAYKDGLHLAIQN
jgi:hypothetical protein